MLVACRLPVYPRLRDTMQASTRSRNKPMHGRNFPERPRLGTYQRPTSSRASLARSGPPTAGARRADGAAETLAQVLDLDVVILACAISSRPRPPVRCQHDAAPG